MAMNISSPDDVNELLRNSCLSEDDLRDLLKMEDSPDWVAVERLRNKLVIPLALFHSYVEDVFDINLEDRFITAQSPPEGINEDNEEQWSGHGVDGIVIGFQPTVNPDWMEDWDLDDIPQEGFAPKILLRFDDDGLSFRVVCVGPQTVKALLRILKAHQQLVLRLLDCSGSRITSLGVASDINPLSSNAEFISTVKAKQNDLLSMVQISANHLLVPIAQPRFFAQFVLDGLSLVPIFLAVSDAYSGRGDHFREYYQTFADHYVRLMEDDEDMDDDEFEDDDEFDDILVEPPESKGADKWNK